MKKQFKLFFLLAIVVFSVTSCSKGAYEPDYPQWGAYVTVATDGVKYSFIGDDGETYKPVDMSRVPYYNPANKDGKRASIYFNVLRTVQEKLNYEIAVYELYDILSKEVEVVDTEEKLKEVGDSPMSIGYIGINAQWLDIKFALMTVPSAMHKLTLCDNTLVNPPTDMPSNYQYLEFRQKPSGDLGQYLADGNVAYELGDYHPTVTGKKGLYIRVNTIESGVKYFKVDYEPQPKSALRQETLAVNSDLNIQ